MITIGTPEHARVMTERNIIISGARVTFPQLTTFPVKGDERHNQMIGNEFPALDRRYMVVATDNMHLNDMGAAALATKTARALIRLGLRRPAGVYPHVAKKLYRHQWRI